MILGAVSLVDCLIFVIFLGPQLLYQAGLISTLVVVAKVLPFLSTAFFNVHETLLTKP